MSRNRELMPTIAAFVDEMQAEFGDARLIYAEENGYEVGTEIQTEERGAIREGVVVSVETGRRRIGPVATPATRRDDPATSAEAEQEITDSGKRADQQRRAVEAVREWPGRTSSELARLAGIDRHALGRRLPEVEAGEGSGDVLRAGTRRDPETGRSGVRWWPIDLALGLMAERIVQSGRPKLAEYREKHGEWVAQQARARAVELWRKREVA